MNSRKLTRLMFCIIRIYKIATSKRYCADSPTIIYYFAFQNVHNDMRANYIDVYLVLILPREISNFRILQNSTKIIARRTSPVK